VPIDEEKRTTLRKFAAVGAGSPLLGLADRDGDGSESDARDAILGFVETAPGTHFSKIRDDLALATGETQYHLRRLTDGGDLDVRRDGDFKRYFPPGRFSDFEQVALGYLRRETPRAMLLGVLSEPNQRGTQLADTVGVSPATISTYGSAMADAGLLDKETGYRVQRPEVVISLVLRYAHTFDDEAESFASEAASLFQYDPDSEPSVRRS
jgi:predicted transcriptional regulator